jgi:transcriptional regulator with XRE-family HTH domain
MNKSRKRCDSRAAFTTRLREARLKSGLSQHQLGLAVGFPEEAASPRISQYERGKHFPELALLDRIAAALNVPVSYLFATDSWRAEWILTFERAHGVILKLLKDRLAQVEKRGGSHGRSTSRRWSR